MFLCVLSSHKPAIQALQSMPKTLNKFEVCFNQTEQSHMKIK